MTLRKAALLVLALSLGTCNQAILTAPVDGVMVLQANPTFIAAHGDVSVISAIVIEKAGTPVADGTVVQFFTDLGRIDEQGKTNDGVARVNLVSDSRSGKATVSAFSGPLSVNPGVIVTIGSARPALLILTVDPPRITGRSASVVARVFDADGNGVANVPVFFTIDGNPSTERFASGGQAVFTDNDGRAADTLFTNYSRELPPKTITVRATSSNGTTDTALVTIN